MKFFRCGEVSDDSDSDYSDESSEASEAPKFISSINVADPKWCASEDYDPDKESSWAYPAEKDGWFMAHNAVRGEIADVKRALTALAERSTVEEWEVDALRTIWSEHQPHIHSHHSNEDAQMNPYLATRINMPPKLQTDHDALLKHMETLDGLISGPIDDKDVHKLLAAWTAYETMMLPHLREEEDICLPLMRAYFTHEEIAPVVQKIVGGGPPVEMGSFIHYAGDEKFFEFMKQEGIPGFVWYIEFKPKRDRFQRLVIQNIEALVDGEQPEPPRSFLCKKS